MLTKCLEVDWDVYMSRGLVRPVVVTPVDIDISNGGRIRDDLVIVNGKLYQIID